MGPENPQQESDQPPQPGTTRPADVPTLDVVEPKEAEAKRPGWLDIPGTIRKTLMRGHPDAALFSFHFRGGAVENRGIQIGFLAQFLEAFRKVYEPLQVMTATYRPEGSRLPRTDAAQPLVSALATTGSVTVTFALAPEEADIVHKFGGDLSGLYSVKATGRLGALLSYGPDEDLLDLIEPFGKRVGRSYGQLAKVLADYQVETDWWSDTFTSEQVEITAPEARTIADELLDKPIAEVESYEIGGFMWEAATGDSSQRFVRIQAGTRSIKAFYDIPLATDVTRALSHVVRAEIEETAFRFPFAEKPHRREWELKRLIEVGDSAGALAEAEQLQLGGT